MKQHSTLLRNLLALGVAASLSACLGSPTSITNKDFTPVIAKAPPAPKQANGAIFQVSHGYAPLTSGLRASMPGDIVTIRLVETTLATKSNDASKDRSGGFSLTPPTTGPFSLFNPSDASASGSQNFSGSASANQSNSLRGTISATVVETYPNGTMLIRGEKLTALNRGDEHMQLSGLIRSIDISADNSIPSTRVANAQIVYGGTGEIADASRQGWLQRFFSFLSPF